MKLIIDNLTFGYHPERGSNAARATQSRVFSNLSFQCPNPTHNAPANRKGCVVAVMGASGTGKSSLIRLLTGVAKPDIGNGKINFYNHDQPISNEALSIAYLPQTPIIFEHLNRSENVRLFSGINRQKVRFNNKQLEFVLDTLDIKDVVEHDGPVGEISGGEQQRIAIARCFSTSPDVICLDEPCAGLDPLRRTELLRQLRILISNSRALAFYATHHFEEAAMIADELLFLHPGDKGVSCGNISQMPFSSAYRDTSNEEIIHYMKSGLWNSVPCRLDGSVVKTLPGNQEGGFAYAKGYSEGANSGQLLFGPEAVKISVTSGISAEVLGSSNMYVFLTVSEVPVIAMSSPSCTMPIGKKVKITLSGEGLFLTGSGKQVLTLAST